VEAREPFIDYKLAELSYRTSTDLKTKNKSEKYILKKALEGLLPEHIIYRKKDGFTIPLDKLFANEKLRKYAFEKINEFNNYEQVFTVAYINKLWNEQIYVRLWQLFMVALWWDNYIMNVPAFVDEEGRLIPEHL
jgi:asparagine synthase (glutamine-hydrolysing)